MSLAVTLSRAQEGIAAPQVVVEALRRFVGQEQTPSQ